MKWLMVLVLVFAGCGVSSSDRAAIKEYMNTPGIEGDVCHSIESVRLYESLENGRTYDVKWIGYLGMHSTKVYVKKDGQVTSCRKGGL